MKVEEAVLVEVDADRKERSGQAPSVRCSVYQPAEGSPGDDNIERAISGGSSKKLDDARTTCDFAVADAERAAAELAGAGARLGRRAARS